MVVALHRHPRFMASHGWADWVEGGRGREPRARYGVRGPESSFLVGASLWWQALGDWSGYVHFPAGAPNAGPRLWLRRGMGGGDGLAALVSQRAKPSSKEKEDKGVFPPRPALCASWIGLGLDSPKPFPVAAERKRQDRGLPPDRGQQARQPAGKGQDRGIGAGSCGSLGAGEGVDAAWAGLGWAVTATAFAPFLWGHPPIPVRLRPRPRRCRLATARSLLMWSTSFLLKYTRNRQPT